VIAAATTAAPADRLTHAPEIATPLAPSLLSRIVRRRADPLFAIFCRNPASLSISLSLPKSPGFIRIFVDHGAAHQAKKPHMTFCPFFPVAIECIYLQ
jgi:hypothetical protein